MKKIIFLILISTLSSAQLQAQTWSSVGNGIEKNIYDLASFDGDLYACGRLGNPWRGVYFWDGTDWHNTSNFWGISYPLSLEVFQDELYTSGDFSGSNGTPTKVFKLQNGEWLQQGENFDGGDWNSVKKLKQFKNHLYAGGQFEEIGNTEAKNIAKWDGQVWTNVHDGIPGLVSRMDVFQDKLIVCHLTEDTIEINDSTTTYVTRRKLQVLENDSWVDLDGTFDNKHVNLIGVIDDELYFGSRDTINGLPIVNVGIWDGTNIQSIGDTLFHSVNHVIEFNNEIYVSCRVKTTNPGFSLSVIRKRENNEWITVGGVFDDSILALHAHNDNLFAGGFFEKYEDEEMKYISVLDNTSNLQKRTKTSEVYLFPNPADSQVSIVSSKNNLLSVEIFTADGKSIWKKEKINNKKYVIDTKEFRSSIYFVKSVLDTNEISVSRFVKN